MKKTIKLLTIVLITFVFNSCNKKEDTPNIDNQNGDSYYKLFVNDNLFSESSSVNINISNDNLYVDSDQNDITINITNIPAIGETENVDFEEYFDLLNVGGDVSELSLLKFWGNLVEDNLDISGMVDMYLGTITRETKYKITFTGTFYGKTVAEDGINIINTMYNFHGEAVASTVIE